MLIKVIDIGNIVEETFAEQFFDDRAAHPIDVHGITRSEMDHSLDFPARAIGVETIMETLDFREGFSTFGTILGHDERPLGTIASLNKRANDFRDDVRGFVKDDFVPNHQAFLGDEILVVERRSLDKASRDANRLEHRIRGDASRAADGQEDIEQFGRDFFRGEFVRDRPFRGLRGVTDDVVKIDVVHLEDKAVDVIAKGGALFVVFLGVRDQFLNPMEFPSLVVCLETELIEIIETLRMDVFAEFFRIHEIIPIGVETTARGDAGIELANAARRGVPRICKQRLPGFEAFVVEPFQRAFGHENLAAHLEGARLFHLEGNGGDLFDVLGDILAHNAVPASHAVLQNALAIDKRHAEAVYFDLSHVVHDILVEGFANLAVPIANLVFVEDVPKGEHQAFMGNLLEGIQHLAADPLRRGRGGLQKRELFLNSLQFLHVTIEFGIAMRRIIEYVILVGPAIQGLGKESRAGFCFFEFHGYAIPPALCLRVSMWCLARMLFSSPLSKWIKMISWLMICLTVPSPNF